MGAQQEEWVGTKGAAVMFSGFVYFPKWNLRLWAGKNLGDPDLIFLSTQALFFPGHLALSLITCHKVQKSHWFHYNTPLKTFSNTK